MTDIGEGVAVSVITVEEDKCIFCGEAVHETTTEKKEGKGELKSIPKNLGCSPIPQDPQVAFYSTAAHHLIPAIQCLAKFARLSQMADSVGYDVNSPKNGLALPTHGQLNKNSYLLEGVKYGDLSSIDKKAVAFDVMKHLDNNPGDYGAQWHVGHHDWSFETVKVLATDTDSISHSTNYDQKVTSLLRDLESKLSKNRKICEPDEGEPGGEVIKKLDKLSEKIEKGIKSWNKYYVSAMAYVYAKEEK